MNYFLSPTLITTVALLALSTTARQGYAQTTVSVGPLVGANLSSVQYEDIPSQPGNTTISTRPGLTTGLVVAIAQRHVAWRPALVFAMQGFILDNEYSTAGQVGETGYYHQEYWFNYLKLPLNVSYSLREDGAGLQVFGGAYASLLLGGSVTYDNRFVSASNTFYYRLETPVRAGSAFPDFKAFYTKRFDTGLQAGIGYRWHGLLAQACYQVGLLNVAATYPSPNPVSPNFYNRTFDLSVAYLLTKH